jgi:hypothetical protein
MCMIFGSFGISSLSDFLTKAISIMLLKIGGLTIPSLVDKTIRPYDL